MRSILAIFLTLFFVTACSKDQRISRKIDGDWKATVFMGSNLDPDEEIRFTFNKDRNGEGTGTMVYTDWGMDEVYGVKYFIKNDYLTMIVDQDAVVFTINDITRKKITLTDNYGDATILEKD
ncbi:MAG: hypothetical protein A3D31_02980 [Candidatus Fluviicola riflensis]|nr:MAG: hypothetical protein CHH17_12060 [Candidatus Fluviicola riflensis]OGS78951.1 MAG: hypothetical protein A3D31_02980 [Candidatus Fluviicola riflensis]OGS85973.1 MAG: hypothetical protein A3E30_10465 [Fluviicola sp. RIFCSPHIGHO2_12_FULL_43_24]OGS86382.1 MAG: hypothetical protein A2724_02435 [Fluviicola sp. RIFCSPHIGHO2_01_FULL_43_53]